ncbi:MAG: transposase [Clostridia bacterium]|nr:transposase [Clostridia bacterium]
MAYHNTAHAVGSLKVHFVWCTKYRYKIIEGAIAIRCRELLRQALQTGGNLDEKIPGYLGTYRPAYR